MIIGKPLSTEDLGTKEEVLRCFEQAVRVAADFYLANTPTDRVPYWDTDAPGLCALGNYLQRPADPWNNYEPFDSSAAAIAAQGFLRLEHYLKSNGLSADAEHYWPAGIALAHCLLEEPYLSTNSAHQGLLLHSIYHRPNGWDYVPPGSKIPRGESSMWGDYHLRELALYLQRILENKSYLKFFA